MTIARRLTPKIIKKVAEQASTSNNRLHVLPREGKWVVRKDGATRIIGIYVSRDAALKVAKRNKSKSKIIVHDRTGNIARVIS